MKKCPACDKIFEDSMRFCQVDGTPLVEDTPFDPFATIVGSVPPKAEAVPESPAAATVEPDEAPAISEPDDVLDLPDADPLRTMYVSDAEMKAALKSDAVTAESEVVEIPPIEDISSEETILSESQRFDMASPDPEPEPELPSFNVPDAPVPNFGDMAPPPSPFSPVDAPERPVSAPSFEEAPSGERQFNEAETMIQGEFTNPFESSATSPIAEWSPPPASDSGWQNQQLSPEPVYTPSSAVPAGQNKTLAIISLVTGILGVTICCGGFLPSLAAIVTGIMARSKASQNPAEFGGAGMAMAGIITGVVGLLGGILVMVFWLLGAFANMATGNF